MCVKLSHENLNFDHYPPHRTNTYRMITALKIHDSGYPFKDTVEVPKKDYWMEGYQKQEYIHIKKLVTFGQKG